MKAPTNLLAFIIILAASQSLASDRKTGTMEHPRRLDCRNLDAIISARQGTGEVISGSLIVEAENDETVPPAVLGCRGGHHIVCVMEIPSGAKRGDRIEIAGRLATIGSNYVMVDPCGVHVE